tara:strand:- start:3564 stop:3911 length:348 start_codon:yes stop_codon:yes gene_type:complete
MNPYIIIGFLLALAGAGAGGFKLGDDHRTAAQAREQKHITEAVDAANNAAAQAIATLKPKYTTIQNKLEKQIEINTIYRDCKLDAVGLQLVNQALNGGAIAPSDSKLPKADTTGK